VGIEEFGIPVSQSPIALQPGIPRIERDFLISIIIKGRHITSAIYEGKLAAPHHRKCTKASTID
jgi:hypothetical protein